MEEGSSTGNISFPKMVSFDYIRRCTDDFTEINFIGRTQFGKLYRGKIFQQHSSSGVLREKEVTVKIGVRPQIHCARSGDNPKRLEEEITFLRHQEVRSHPGFCKVIAFYALEIPYSIRSECY